MKDMYLIVAFPRLTEFLNLSIVPTLADYYAIEEIFSLTLEIYIYNLFYPKYDLYDLIFSYFETEDFGLYDRIDSSKIELNDEFRSEIQYTIHDKQAACVDEILLLLKYMRAYLDLMLTVHISDLKKSAYEFLVTENVLVFESNDSAVVSFRAEG